jgi:SynChlorMet cassette protein ScmC
MIELQKAVGLSLANEFKLAVIAGDEPTCNILSRLAEIMKLQQIDDPALEIVLKSNELKSSIDEETGDGYPANPCVLLKSSLWTIYSSLNKDRTICEISEQIIESDFSFQILCTSMLIGLLAMNREGMLMHGALVAKDECGVILAGRSGVGKTTASSRLPKPWQSLSDDMTLVVRDSKGAYWAHPLPSHSIFAFGKDGMWDVQHAVPLKGIFILRQSKIDQAQPLIKLDSVIYVMDSAEQAMINLLSDRFNRIDGKTRSSLLGQLFNNSCTLCKTVPVHQLNISLHGEFWREIDRALNGNMP